MLYIIHIAAMPEMHGICASVDNIDSSHAVA